MLDLDTLDTAQKVAPSGVSAALLAFFWNFFNKKHEEHRDRSKVMFAKIDELRASMHAQNLESARTYVARHELDALRNHIDHKFEVLTQQIMDIPNRMRKT